MKRINNKGFTLIEVIGIVVILVAIFLIAFPSLLGITKKEEEKIYTVMLDDLCLAGESYIYSNMDKFPQLSTPNSTIKLKISTLVEYGNISKNTVNSKTDKSVINDFLIFTILSDNSLSCEYKENDGEDAPVICSAVYTPQAGSVKRGVEYECQVNETDSYNFYVLSTSGDSVNLLMEENLVSSVSFLNRNVMSTYDDWSSYFEDYNNVTDDSYVINYVESETTEWSNLTSYNEEYTSGDYVITLSGKARLPKYEEISSLCTCVEDSSENQSTELFRSNCPDWIKNTSYWTMDFVSNSFDIPAVWAVNSEYETLDDFNLYREPIPTFGIRPVITVLKSQLEGYDPDDDDSEEIDDTPTTCPTTGGGSGGDDSENSGDSGDSGDICEWGVYYRMGAGYQTLDPSSNSIYYFDYYSLSIPENIDSFEVRWNYGSASGTMTYSFTEYKIPDDMTIYPCEDFTDDSIIVRMCDSTSPLEYEQCK